MTSGDLYVESILMNGPVYKSRASYTNMSFFRSAQHSRTSTIRRTRQRIWRRNSVSVDCVFTLHAGKEITFELGSFVRFRPTVRRSASTVTFHRLFFSFRANRKRHQSCENRYEDKPDKTFGIFNQEICSNSQPGNRKENGI